MAPSSGYGDSTRGGRAVARLESCAPDSWYYPGEGLIPAQRLVADSSWTHPKALLSSNVCKVRVKRQAWTRNVMKKPRLCKKQVAQRSDPNWMSWTFRFFATWSGRDGPPTTRWGRPWACRLRRLLAGFNRWRVRGRFEAIGRWWTNGCWGGG